MALDARIAEQARQWRMKPSLRKIYGDLYRRMAAACVPGRTLEVGGGAGGFKEFKRDCISSDLLFAPWLDVVADAQRLPFAGESMANIVLFDVLHHLPYPRRFLAEAARVLRPGGRVIFVEPAITPLSWPFYRFLHHEPVRFGVDPLSLETPLCGADAFDSNQAVPTLLTGRFRAELEAAFPQLELRSLRRVSLFAYPLSGGFKPWTLVPSAAVDGLLALERRVEPLLGAIMGFRLLAVIEKKSTVARA
jgi:SAM-dependent methyltransferase